MASLSDRIIEELSTSRPCHIVDVGANPIGDPVSYRGLLDRGVVRVTGFEPQADALERLKLAKGPNETYLPHAVGTGESVRLRVFRGSGFASCFEIDETTVDTIAAFRRYTRQTGEFELPTVALDMCDEVGAIDFLRIDVQGMELDIIRNGAKKLALAVAIQTEARFFPLYKGEPGFGELDSELRRQGFLLHDFVDFNRVKLNSPHYRQVRRKHKRQIIDGDAIYVRDLRQIAEWSTDQVRNLALLALGAFASPDLCIFALSELARREEFDQVLLDSFIAQL